MTIHLKYKYTGITKDNNLIQSNNLKDFKIQEMREFTITENMTLKELMKRFGVDSSFFKLEVIKKSNGIGKQWDYFKNSSK